MPISIIKWLCLSREVTFESLAHRLFAAIMCDGDTVSRLIMAIFCIFYDDLLINCNFVLRTIPIIPSAFTIFYDISQKIHRQQIGRVVHRNTPQVVVDRAWHTHGLNGSIMCDMHVAHYLM